MLCCCAADVLVSLLNLFFDDSKFRLWRLVTVRKAGIGAALPDVLGVFW